ncbi:MAG: PQQ-binding-like beta-propeller repeat protein [Pirellulales bacterium]
MDSSEKPDSESKPPRRARHRWFPVLLMAAAVTWWMRQESYAEYHTFNHFLVLLFTALGLSLWYAIFAGATRRVRLAIVGGLWLAFGAWLAVFRPIYNGDMWMSSWGMRFALRADERLEPLEPAGVAADWQTTPQDYPRFLGNGNWAEVHGVELQTDWQAHPPQPLWRREIGGGWSAFAIVGNYAVTQEQRGQRELVSCYRVETGEPVWVHADIARFDPADVAGGLGDIGPRATPTIVGERIVTQGGTGIVNCLDARTGRVLWSHDTAEEFAAPVALWGKSGSPLVVDDLVVISVGAPSGARRKGYKSSLVAFDIESGDVRWAAGARKASYASPVLAELAGERQIVVVNENWVTGHRASDGQVLWEHPWAHADDRDASCSQPMPLEGDKLLLSKGYGVGASLLQVRRDAAGKFSAHPLWDPAIKRVMKTKFSNVVIRDGFVYGLDDVLLECIELETGKVRWKKRRSPVFGHGQIMLIGEVILVLSESGELALVAATPDEYRELASLQVLDDANVTWNNPAFAPPYLLVRNAREAACYRLAVKKK